MKKKTFKDFEDYQDYVNYFESVEGKTDNKSFGEQGNNVYENYNIYYSPRKCGHCRQDEEESEAAILTFLANHYPRDWKNPWSGDEEEKEIPKVKKK